MKIGLISPYDYSSPGGVVVHISFLARYFRQMGHKVKVLAPCSREGTSYFGEEVVAIGKPIPIPSGGSTARIALSPWLPMQVRKILEEEEFDIIHLHEPLVPMLCLAALFHSRATNVGTFHAYHGRPWEYWIGKPVFKSLLSRLHGKIAVSKPALEFVGQHLPGDYCVIPNGVDLEGFSPNVSPRKEFEDGKSNILFVSRLEERKGLNYLLNAYAKVKGRFPNVRLIIVGPRTKLGAKYERLTRDMCLADVIFTGFVQNAELPSYYRSADIFCAPATGGESFGLVLLEAMASDKPVIASNIGGYNDLLTHGEEGLLVPPRNEEALTEALSSLLVDESLRCLMGAKGRAKAERYDWANIAGQVIGYYIDLLGRV